jgi:hypothetical protein
LAAAQAASTSMARAWLRPRLPMRPWPEFSELNRTLQFHLHELTLRVIREKVYSDTSEALEVSEALPPN